MRVGKALALALLVVTGTATAEAPFTGAFSGTGRACNGMLQVHTKTIEWKSSFSTCRRGAYEVLEKNEAGSKRRIAFRLKAHGRKCLYEVLSLEQVEGTDWTADAYPSLEAFRKKDQPDWLNSPLPERLVLECPMTQLR